MKKQDLFKKAGFRYCELCDDWRFELFNPSGADWCLIVDDRDNFGADEVDGVEGGDLGSVETFGARMVAATLDLLIMYKKYDYININDVMPFYWVGGLLNYNDDIKINDYAKIGALKFWRSSWGAVLCAALVYVGGSQFWARVSLGGCIDLYDLATIND